MYKIRRKRTGLIGTMILCMIILLANVVSVGAAEDADSNRDKTKDVVFTLYDYDWTSYQKKNPGAVQEYTSGDKNPNWGDNKSEYALKDVEFTLIKVAQMDNTIDEDIKKLLFEGDEENMARTKFTEAELTAVLQTSKQKVETYACQEDSKKYGVFKTDENGKIQTTIPAKDQGIYLVVETKVPENVDTTTVPFLVMLPMTNGSNNGWNYDVYVYPKNETSIPTVKKLVKDNDDTSYKDSTSVTCGDVVHYNLIGEVPKVTSTATEFSKFGFEDHLPVGIECELNEDGTLKNVDDVHVRIYDSEEDARQVTENGYTELIYGEDYTLEYVKVDNGNSIFRIFLTKKGLAKLNRMARDGRRFLSVSYCALVGDLDELIVGDEGNRSDVTLIYARTATTDNAGTIVSEQEIEDAAVVYMYGFEIQKKFDVKVSDDKLIHDVQFIVKNNKNNKYIQAEMYEDDDPSLADDYIKYKVVNSVENREDATAISPDEKGVVILDGVQAGDYEIEEVKTVDGYVLLKEPIKISISAKEIVTQPTTVDYAGLDEKVDSVGISEVKGKEKATATVNGEPAEVTEEGRVPRVRLTILNKKETAANVIEDVIDNIVPTTEDSVIATEENPTATTEGEYDEPDNSKEDKKEESKNTVEKIVSKVLPKTGDDAQILVSFMGLLISIFLIVVILKKKKDEK